MERKQTNLEDDQEDGDDDDDVEPKLTYTRIGHDVANVMKTDTANCMTFHERVGHFCCIHL